jgi:hypothetical protein
MLKKFTCKYIKPIRFSCFYLHIEQRGFLLGAVAYDNCKVRLPNEAIEGQADDYIVYIYKPLLKTPSAKICPDSSSMLMHPLVVNRSLWINKYFMTDDALALSPDKMLRRHYFSAAMIRPGIGLVGVTVDETGNTVVSSALCSKEARVNRGDWSFKNAHGIGEEICDALDGKATLW